MIFLDEIIPAHIDKNFKYEIYLPLIGYKYNIWTPACGFLISEDTIELIDIPKIEYSKIKVKDVNLIDFDQNDLDKLTLKFRIGDRVKTDIDNADNELILTKKNKLAP